MVPERARTQMRQQVRWTTSLSRFLRLKEKKHFIVQLRALLWNSTIKAPGCSLPAAYYVLKYEHSSILKVPLRLLLLLRRYSHVLLCATPQTAAHQAPPSLGFSRQEHWSGLPFPSPRHGSKSEVAQLCLTPSDPTDSSPPGSPIPGILQARTLEWVAISFSNAWKWKVKLLRPVWLFETPWTTAYQAPPSKGFSRQEY